MQHALHERRADLTAKQITMLIKPCLRQERSKRFGPARLCLAIPQLHLRMASETAGQAEVWRRPGFRVRHPDLRSLGTST